MPTSNSTLNAVSNKTSQLNIFEEEKADKNSNLDELQEVYSRLVSDTKRMPEQESDEPQVIDHCSLDEHLSESHSKQLPLLGETRLVDEEEQPLQDNNNR